MPVRGAPFGGLSWDKAWDTFPPLSEGAEGYQRAKPS